MRNVWRIQERVNDLSSKRFFVGAGFPARSGVNGEANMRIVAASGGNDNTLLRVRTLRPHMVLLHLGLRSHNNIRVVASLTKGVPGIKVTGKGLIPSRPDIIELVGPGATGFILKDEKSWSTVILVSTEQEHSLQSRLRPPDGVNYFIILWTDYIKHFQIVDCSLYWWSPLIEAQDLDRIM